MTIDEDKLREAFADLRARVTYLEVASGLFASEEDLAGPKGDPTVRFAPRGWNGPEDAVKGKRYSQCAPDFLDVLAETLEYSGRNPKPDKVQFAAGNLADARRARSWARRLRAGGWTPPVKSDRGAIGRPGPPGRPAGLTRPAPVRPERAARPARPVRTGAQAPVAAQTPHAHSIPDDERGPSPSDDLFGLSDGNDLFD